MKFPRKRVHRLVYFQCGPACTTKHPTEAAALRCHRSRMVRPMLETQQARASLRVKVLHSYGAGLSWKAAQRAHGVNGCREKLLSELHDIAGEVLTGPWWDSFQSAGWEERWEAARSAEWVRTNCHLLLPTLQAYHRLQYPQT